MVRKRTAKSKTKAKTRPVKKTVKPVKAPAKGVAARVNTCYIGRNPTTGGYSVACDSPGESGTGNLIKAGFTQIVFSGTWAQCAAKMHEWGVPGW